MKCTCKGQPFGLLRAAHGVTDQQMQPAAADRQPGGGRRLECELCVLPTEAAQRQLRRIGSAEHSREADEQRENRQQHRKQEQKEGKYADISSELWKFLFEVSVNQF